MIQLSSGTLTFPKARVDPSEKIASKFKYSTSYVKMKNLLKASFVTVEKGVIQRQDWHTTYFREYNLKMLEIFR